MVEFLAWRNVFIVQLIPLEEAVDNDLALRTNKLLVCTAIFYSQEIVRNARIVGKNISLLLMTKRYLTR